LTDPELQPPLEPDSEPAELADTVVRGAGLAGAGYIVNQVLTLGFYVALARLASPADFGDLAAGTVLINIGMLFSESGMLAALIHRKDRIDEAASTATIATLLAGFALGLVALAASPVIGTVFHSSRIGEVAAASSGLLMFRSLRIVPTALLQRRFSFLRRLIIEPVGVVVFGTSAVILTANGLGVWGLVLGYYAMEVADVLLSWSLLGWRPRLSDASVAMWRELVRYGRWGVAANALQNVEQQGPVVLLGRFAGAGMLGQFRYAARMESSAAAIVVQAGAYVLFPALARITSDRERFRDACLRSLRSMSMIGFPMGILLVPLGVPAAVIAFGDVWRDAGYAAMALAGVAVTGTLISFASEVLKADGRPDILTRIRFVTLIAVLAGMIALLPFDLIGVCLGFSLGTFVGVVYAIVRVAQQLEIPARRLAREVLPTAAAAVFMAAVLTLVEFLLVDASSHGTAVGLGLLGLEGLLGIVLYLLALRVLSPDSFREFVSLVFRMLRRGGGTKSDAEPSPSETAGPADEETQAGVSLP
jgi:O-antigen/teichoic acid export membrane protein